MSHAPFTEAAEPAVEAAVGRTLRRLTDAAAGIAGVSAVLLGGSLGRGEGTPGDGGLLASDVEVYLVGTDPALRAAAAGLEEAEAADGAGPSVSVAWLEEERLRRGWAKNLSRRPSRTIQLYELGAGSRVLSGRLPEILPVDPATLPIAEGIRLILNRFAEAGPMVAAGDPDAGRWLDKILIACGDTLLLARNAYTVRYRDRAARLATTTEPWSMPDGWRPPILAAYERKLRGQAATAPAVGAAPEVVTAATLAADVLRGALGAAAGSDIGAWEGFPEAYLTVAARDDAFLRYLPPVGPASTYEAMLVLVRARRAGLGIAPRAAWQAARGRPLSLAMQGAAAPMFLGIAGHGPGDGASLRSAAVDAMRDAGVPASVLRRAGDQPEAVASVLRRYWEAVA